MGVKVGLPTDTIANGASLGSGVNLNDQHLVGIVMPAAWTAAALTFSGSLDNSTWFDIYDNNGVELTVQAAASRFIAIPAGLLPPLPYLRVRSGTSGTPVNQAGARILTFRGKFYE
jgi:hypothetical protein